MDLRIFAGAPENDFYAYAPPESYELFGKDFTVNFDGGDSTVLSFTQGCPLRCVKASDGVWLASDKTPGAPVCYVLDLKAGLCTKAVPVSGGGFELAFGAIDGSDAARHAPSRDFDGNTVEWTFGINDSSAVSVRVFENSAELTRPFAKDAPILSASNFQVVKISQTVYLQTADVSCGELTFSVCLLSDFVSLLCAGTIISGDDIKFIGGCGRVTDASSNGVGLNLKDLSPYKGGAIDQYTPPRCFELSGRTLELIMDDGYDFFLDFFSDDTLRWNRAGDAPESAKYSCLKADDTTYLVAYELQGVTNRCDHTFVIDMENMLVTRIISTIGTNPRWPYLMKNEFEFGAISDGHEFKSYPRHGFTSDVTGNIVQWTYGAEMATVHVYYCSDFYRITYPRDRVASKEGAQVNEEFAQILKALPSADEPMSYIKIKDGMYLVSLSEINGEKLLGAKMVYRSDTLCFLQNYKTGRNVGRGFGTMTPKEGPDNPVHIMIGAFGRILEPKDDELKKMLTAPNPYLP